MTCLKLVEEVLILFLTSVSTKRLRDSYAQQTTPDDGSLDRGAYLKQRSLQTNIYLMIQDPIFTLI